MYEPNSHCTKELADGAGEQGSARKRPGTREVDGLPEAQALQGVSLMDPAGPRDADLLVITAFHRLGCCLPAYQGCINKILIFFPKSC